MASERTMFGRWRFLILVVLGFGSCAAPVRNRPALLAAVRKVEAFYHANGYLKARVTVRFDVPAPLTPPFVFFVEEG